MQPTEFEAIAVKAIAPYICDYAKGKDPIGGLIPFEKMPYGVLEKLMTELPREMLADQQNEAPTIRQFLNNHKKEQDTTTFEGYVVVPPRPDWRISIDGVTCAPTTDNLLRYVKTADEQHPQPDGRIRFWWD